MVYCCVMGCRSKSIRGCGHRFFSIPAVITNQCEKTKLLSIARRKLWLERINRKNYKTEDDSRNRKVCDKHFISGIPSKLFDNLSPDWAPSVNLGYVIPNILAKKKKMTARKVPKIMKAELVKQEEIVKVLEEDEPPEKKFLPEIKISMEKPVKKLPPEIKISTEKPVKKLSTEINISTEEPEKKLPTEMKISTEKPARNLSTQLTEKPAEAKPPDVSSNIPVLTLMLLPPPPPPIYKSESSSQTDITGCLIESMGKDIKMTRDDNIALRTCIHDLKKALDSSLVNELSLSNNNDKVKFYTGFPTFQALKSCYNLITSDKEWALHNSLSPFQEFLVTLMRLRLNLYEQDLAYRFAVSQATVSRIITRWLPLMSEKLKSFITFDRDSIKSNIPQLFKDTFGENTCLIIDFFEILIGRPNQQSKSARFLVAIMPQGSVSFVSRAEGDSDEQIIENSGILNNLIEGEVAMVNLEDSGGFVSARVVKDEEDNLQLSFKNIVSQKKLSKLKSYVENSMNYVKSKYHIMEAVLAPEVLLVRKGGTEPALDYIVTVCCALANMCRSSGTEGKVAG